MFRIGTFGVCVVVTMWGAGLGAQASPYLHIGHPAYDAMGFLLDRGLLQGLSPVVRPYRRLDVARAVMRADTTRANGIERALLARLRVELGPELRALGSREPEAVPSVAGELRLEGTLRSQRHRDPLRPEGKGLLGAAAEVDLRAAFGSVALETRLRSDNYYLHDPQFPERVATNRFNQRAEDAYVEVQGRHVRALLGRLYREWSPPGVASTLLSSYAPSFDQVGLWVGTEKVSLSLLAARLDDFPGDVRRYLALHRLDWQPSPDLALYAAEAVLYGGPGRDFELEFLNPVSFWYNEVDNERAYRETHGNALGAVGAWWRASRSLVLFADFTLDDVKVDRGAANGLRYAFFTGAALPRLAGAASARVSYTQVSSLAYRSFADFERYSFRDVGLARDISDYGLVSAEITWFPRADLRLTPSMQVLFRGEGDFRDPFPADFDTLPKFLIGEVETTLRLALAGRWEASRAVSTEWDVGANLVTNPVQQRGGSRTRFVGRLGVRWVLGRAHRLQ